MPAADGNTRGWTAGSQLTGNNITVIQGCSGTCTCNTGKYLQIHIYVSLQEANHVHRHIF